MNDAEVRKKEELFVRIALDNKLVSKWHIKKATEEQDKRAKEDGKRPGLGPVLLALGYLTDRQFQSVENAQRYREQRDFDKRIGRQVLRMALLDQTRVEECLESQKQEYTKSGAVKGLAQVMAEKGLLTQAQVAEVLHAIDQRDKTKGPATRGMLASGPVSIGAMKDGADEEITPLRDAAKTPSATAPTTDPDELAELRDLQSPEPASDAASAAADDAKGDDLGDLERKGTDEVEAEKEAAADEAGAGDDADAEDAGEGDDDDDGAEDEDAEDVDDDDDDSEEDDEDSLAEELEELPDGSDVELDKEDLETIEELESGSDPEVSTGWAADAFDDRPIAKRSDTPSSSVPTAVPASRATPSGSVPAATPLKNAAPPRAEPAKAEPAKHEPVKHEAKADSKKDSKDRHEALAAAKALLAKKPAGKGAAKDATAIPGGEVLESESNVAARSAHDIPGGEVLEDSATASVPGPAATAVRPSPAQEKLAASTRGLETLLKKVADELGPGSRGHPKSERTESTQAASPQAATLSASREPAAPTRTVASTASPEPASAADEESSGPAPAPPAGEPSRPALDLDDPRVRRAFERAMEAAWKVFREELGG